MPEGKYPEPTYRSSYTKHEVSPILIAKESGTAGIESSLSQEKKNRYDCSYQEQILYSRCPPLESIEKQRVQYSAVPMRDQEKICDKETTCSSFFRQSGDHRPYSPRAQMPDSQLCVQRRETCGQPGETVNNKLVLLLRDKPLFPVHVDGSSISTVSNVTFGRSDLTGKYYSTTSQEQLPSKEVLRPKPSVYPPSHVLLEQESDWMITTMQKDFVPLNSRRQELSPNQLQQVKFYIYSPVHEK